MSQEVYEGTEIDRCPTCRGMYFDRGELRRMARLDVGTGDTLAFSAISDTMDKIKAHCHKCAVDMTPQMGPAGIRIDKCPKCSGIFLDEGELATLQLHGN